MPTALRGLMALAGLPVAEKALHSRVGDATSLSAGGASADVEQREGRLRSDAFIEGLRKIPRGGY